MFLRSNLQSVSIRMVGLFYAKGIVLLSTVFVARRLGPENYGHIRVTLTMFHLLGIFAGFPMERVVASLVGRKPEQRINILFNSVFFLLIITTIALVFFYILLSIFNIVNDDLSRSLFFKYSPFVYFYVLSFVFLAYLQGSGKILAMTIGETVYGSLKALSIILFVYFTGFSGWLRGRITGELLSFVTIISFSYFFYRGIFSGKKIKLDYNLLKKLMKYYTYRITESGLAAFQVNLDVFLVLWLVNDVKQIAYIGTAKMFLTSFGIFGKSITSGLFPSIVKLYNRRVKFLKHLLSTQVITNLLFIIFLIPIFVFSKQIIIIIYKDQYIQAVPYLRVFIVAAIFQNISYINGGYWLAVGNVKLSTKFSIYSFIIYTITSLIMMYYFDVYGIVLAILISKIVNALISSFLNKECII